MFLDGELRAMLGGHAWMVRQGIGWREDSWSAAQQDPQVHADLSLLYGLAEDERHLTCSSFFLLVAAQSGTFARHFTGVGFAA